MPTKKPKLKTLKQLQEKIEEGRKMFDSQVFAIPYAGNLYVKLSEELIALFVEHDAALYAAMEEKKKTPFNELHESVADIYNDAISDCQSLLIPRE